MSKTAKICTRCKISYTTEKCNCRKEGIMSKTLLITLAIFTMLGTAIYHEMLDNQDICTADMCFSSGELNSIVAGL